MVDELLASTWEPTDPTFDTRSCLTSFSQHTSSLNALQSVLAASIERLVQHRKVVSNRIAELEQDSRRVSSKFHEGLLKPDMLLNDICAQMEDLEERFTKVSSSAVTIGDKLSTLDTERSRVLETDEVMEALLALNDPSSKLTKSSNKLFNTLHDPNQLHEASRIIKKMSAFSSELSSSAMAYAVAEIERLSQTTENNLLTEFSHEQEKENLTGMRRCAESLIEYNDKEKVADRYVWNVMCDQLATAAGEPVTSSLDPIEDLDALFSKILTICTDQFPVIDSVFPAVACASIRELLVERLFNDPAFGVLSFLDQFLKTRRYTESPPDFESASSSTSSSPNRDYVRLLCSSYERACVLVAEIEDIDQSKANKPDAVSNQDSSTRIHTFLNLQLHSLFGNHRDKYLQAELDLLQDQFKDIIASVSFPQPPVLSRSKGGVSQTKTVATTTVTITSSSSPSASSIQLVSSASTTSISSSNLEKDISQLESSLVFFETLQALAEDEDVAIKYGEVLNETIDRCDIVLKSSELRGELITKAFTSFVASFGDEYLGMRFTQFLDDQFEASITPLQEDLPTELTICQESKQKCLNKLESAIGSGLQQVLTVLEKAIGQILTAHQNKGDFLGSQASMSLSSSKACQKCTEYLQPLVTVLCRVLIEENCDHFLVALTKSFKDLYLQHLRKFRFDPDGACMLLRDVSEYRQALRSPSVPAAVNDLFDLLHEVANVFALPPENLGGFVREGKLATLDTQTLHHIVKRRWDYKANADKIAASLKDARAAMDGKST
ncbi:exocyst complex component, putative [Phytophthora infestans T30-4]|uniref:Exocyst complex component, putative n=1 Tax=Phytophthora infestans (strain T30-4) TaxID=403677 RepID=D0NX56_PHYIT|nr:exocyst complex component, putative [Phytophthora infestans T30-4]EEY67651.1 exocyst complex component, putative [Phytophthora infestans T30-4]|eukprot:XP_002896314.1 exocyst complex component, putative [Phytophthora infestans T30-4]